MKRTLLALAGLAAPALALAQAPIVPLHATPAAGPVMKITADPVKPAAPAPAAPAVPAPTLNLPSTATPCDKGECDEEQKADEKFFLEKLLATTSVGKTLGDNGWRIYGWTQGSYNASSASRSNLPVPFIDRANEFSLNQNWLHVEKTIDTSKSELQWGLVADGILPGTDYRTTVSRGLFDGQVANGTLYGFDLFQAYADIYLPNFGGNGTTFRFGKFATHCEYEVVQAIGNPFISRSYLFQYNPFTHTGVNAITQLNDDWTWSNGLVLGNDNFIDPTARLTYLGQLKWAPKDSKTTVMFGTSVTNPRFDPVENFNYYNVYNLQLTHKLCDNFNYIADASFSHMDNVPGVGSTNWYGLVNYFLYDHTDKLQSKVRLEAFNDTHGIRTGAQGLYTAATYGVTWKATDYLWFMPEVRYDYAAGGRPFEGDNDLFTAAIGAILRW